MLTDAAPSRILMPEDLRRPPRYATRRNPALRTHGGKIGVLAAETGKPYYPHQQYIVDVGTELNPPGSRLLYRYQLVVCALPRQVGKTTMMRPRTLHRLLYRPNTQVYMTAQLGKYSADRWEDLVKDYESSPLIKSFIDVKRGKGDQRCTLPNGSFVAPFAPGRDALHSTTPAEVDVDEGWAFSGERGADLMRAVRPAQITRRDRQLWIFSAAGDSSSEWWNALVDAGRKSVDDPKSKMAYFEWSMDPDADPYDPANWEFHPGLDGLITIEDLVEEAKPENNSHGDWLRGFMNISTKTRDNTVLDMSVWDGRTATLSAPDPTEAAYAYDVAIDRTSASIYSAWRDDTGVMNVSVYKTDEGVKWLVPEVKRMKDDGLTVVADDGGPARAVTRQLERQGYDIPTMTGKDYATAWTEFKGMVKDGPFRHDGSPALRSALEVAVEGRGAGDNPSPSRKHSLGAIDSLIAAIGAVWQADNDSGLFIG